jgi:hypothetical protein
MKIQEYKNQKNSYYFFCPGCNEFHSVRTTTPHNDGLKFELQGNKENPTFVPIAQPIPRTIEKFNKSTHDSIPGYTCLSIIRSGHIRFLPQSTHLLAGQQVELPELRADQI